MARPTPARQAAPRASAGKPSVPGRASLPVPVTGPAPGPVGRASAPALQTTGRPGGRSAPARQSSATKTALLTLILLLPLALIFLPTTLLLAIGMLPTVVAVIIDREPEKYAAITVAPLNFCGVLPWLIKLWRGHHTMADALASLSDPLTLMIMLGAAGAGWLLYYGIPPVVAAVITQRNNTEIKRMREHQAKLVAEWGAEVAGTAGSSPGSPALTEDAAPEE